MIAQGLADAGTRQSAYDRLARRNRLVGLLRIVVPALAALGIAYFVGALVLASLAQNFGLGGVSIDKGALVIDAPHYKGVIADGTRYDVTAQSATSAIASPDLLDLHRAELVLTRSDGASFTVTAGLARYNLSEQIVTIAGTAHVVDSRGTTGDLENVLFDWADQTLVARSGAQLTFADGSTLSGKTLTYDGKAAEWTFTRAVLTTANGEAGL